MGKKKRSLKYQCKQQHTLINNNSPSSVRNCESAYRTCSETKHHGTSEEDCHHLNIFSKNKKKKNSSQGNGNLTKRCFSSAEQQTKLYIMCILVLK